MNNLYTNIRGTSDFSVEETNLFNDLTNKARQIFQLFNYQEIILPVLEEEGVFVRGLGDTTDIVEKQIFKVVRQVSQESNIVLRPEGTAQVIRYYLQNYLYKQSDFYKFCYIGPMFRGERPQKGRLRQFHHIGAEAIGADNIYLDVEIILLALNILNSLGITEQELKINTLGCKQDKDKFAQELKEELKSKFDYLCDDCKRRLDKNPLRVLDCKEESCKKVVGQIAISQKYLCQNCKDHFNRIKELLDLNKVNYIYSPNLVRGLDYYTNLVFEITSKSLGSQDALGAGGRYNNLIKSLGGPEIPAIGFALGIERLILALNKTLSSSATGVFIAVMDESFRQEAMTIVNQLRQIKVPCDMDYCAKSLKGQLRSAQKRGAKYVVLFAPDEFKEGCIVLKDMSKSTQEKIKIDQLLKIMPGLLDIK